MTYFQTKLRPEDFIVTEILAKDPDGYWDFHYILLEKKNLTTFLLLDLLIKDFALNKNMVGIAGLKDKNAVTRQRISISKRDVAKNCGGINTLLAWMRNKGRVVTATYGDHMLKLGENAGNHFTIKLVPDPTFVLPETTRTHVATILTDIATQWVPNYFGEQRFGHGGTNRKIGHELLAGTIRNIKGDKNTLAEKRFKVQAFASYVFNVYLEEREKKWLLYKTIPWDIMSKDGNGVTWPVPGDDLALASQDAGALEKAVFAKAALTQPMIERFKTFWLFGIRRPIMMFPKDIKHNRSRGELTVSFSLPSWAYATVIIDQLEKQLLLLAGKPIPLKWSKFDSKWSQVPPVSKKDIKNDKNPVKPSSKATFEAIQEPKRGFLQQKKDKKDAKRGVVPPSKTLTIPIIADKKPIKEKKEKDPSINPYTGQKYNSKKLAEKKKQEKRPQKWFVNKLKKPNTKQKNIKPKAVKKST